MHQCRQPRAVDKQTLGSDRCSVARPSGAAIGIAALSRFIGHQFVSSLFYQFGSAGRGLRAPTSLLTLALSRLRLGPKRARRHRLAGLEELAI